MGEREVERNEERERACALILGDYGHSGLTYSHITACSVGSRCGAELEDRTVVKEWYAAHTALSNHTPYLSRDPELSHKLPTGKYFRADIWIYRSPVNLESSGKNGTRSLPSRSNSVVMMS